MPSDHLNRSHSERKSLPHLQARAGSHFAAKDLSHHRFLFVLFPNPVNPGGTLKSLAKGPRVIPFGIMLWMVTEYFSHRYVLHRHWKVSQRKFKRPFTLLAHKYLDPTHFGHHEKPFDGEHMSGRIRDLLPLFVVGVPLSILLFPPFTASIIVAFAFQSYIAEEWIHHATHFYNFRDPYFRYMKKHHLYHHTSHGMTRGFGTSSGILDYIFMTRFPKNVRQRLYGGRKRAAPNQAGQSIKQAQSS